MANTASNVVVGKPKTAGGVYSAPTGTTLPATAAAALTSFTGLGYVSDAGLSMTKGGDIQTIRAWGGEPVKIIKATDDVQLSWVFIETSDAVLSEVFGADQVASGVTTTITVNKTQVGPRAWVFDMLDGDFAIRIVVPNGEMTGEVQVTFVDGQPVSWPAQITALPDESGNKAYIYKTEFFS